MQKIAVIENVATLVCTTALVLGLGYLGFGGHSLWGLVLLFNMNSFSSSNAQ